jgi:predicted P-loop ATPase
MAFTCETERANHFELLAKDREEKYQTIKEENEKLKAENECFKDCADTLIALQQKYLSLLKENERLKSENKQLTGISGQLKVLSIDDEIKLNQIISPRIKELEAQLERTSQFYKELQQENAQLKAQLQNCDKVSQDIFNNHNMMPDHARETGEIVGETERKPHVCTVCDGRGKAMDNNISIGIHCILDPNLFLDEAGNRWVRCGTCNGTGIVWEPQ